MNKELARMLIETAMRSEPDPVKRKRVGRDAWRAYSIELAHLEMIAEADARGLQLVTAAAAKADDPTRRLRLHRGQWQMRITITTVPLEVGKQHIIPMETADLAEAQAKRDFLERTFERIGFLSSRATAGIK